MDAVRQRTEALKLLTGDSKLLDAARRITAICRAADISAPVVGGVAVVLHGHVRTTLDVDIFVADVVRDALAEAFQQAGTHFDPHQREFDCDGVPIHFQQLRHPPRAAEDREDIRVVSLADLIDMKLRSGSKSVARAQDLADVIGLIRTAALNTGFARQLRPDTRLEFRRIVRELNRAT